MWIIFVSILILFWIASENLIQNLFRFEKSLSRHNFDIQAVNY